ncbi:hypothetical protein ACFOVU_10695 [Nocardiopsis sediminis]|uniref:Uncharacterized protein n=1 Tax=Nocardiopsis sediminis TaxID=1778267 RepID=A0ABV8FN98_9ACTN
MDLDAVASDTTPTYDDIEEAVAPYLPLDAARTPFAVWMELEWGDYAGSAPDITVGEVLAAALRDWRGSGTPGEPTS